MKIHRVSPHEALTSLHSGINGLPEAEARRRLEEFGANRVEEMRGERLALRCAREFTHFFALILWLAAALAFAAEWRDPGQGMAALGYAIVGVILINGIFSFLQEYRAEKALAALRELLPQQVKALRAGKVAQIPAADLVPGDLVLLSEGDNIPADCRVIEAFGARVNNATITGESLPRARDANPSEDDDLLRSRNILLAGTAMVSGEAQAVVFATGMRTEFGKIARLAQTAGEPLSPLQKEIARLSRLVAALATLLGMVFFLIGQLLEFPFWENLIFAIGIIVANVPEGLLPTVTLALAMATQRMAKRAVLIRHLPAVETLGSTTVICTDKTGTLTQNRMTAKMLFFSGEFHPPGDLGRAELRAAALPLLESARHCHNLAHSRRGGRSEWLGDPMEIALVQMAQQSIPGEEGFARINEIPFDTDRKRLSVIYRTPRGAILYCKGALETVLPLCDAIHAGGASAALTERDRELVARAQEEMARQGLRVLAFAYRRIAEDELQPEGHLTLCGLAGLEDPPRPEVPAAVGKCRSAGIKVIMVTGDHPHTATAIAREIGLAQNPLVVTGEELRRLSQTQLQLALDEAEIIFARIGADQKMQIVTALKEKGEVVAVTGDGVNDAPALKCADIGISMGISGTDVAKASADMILLDDNFASIVAAIEEGRAVFDNIRRFLTYILTSNIPELVPYLAFALFKIPLPLTIIQILAVDLGTDMLPALGLGAEKPDHRVMARPPRPRSERLLNWALVARAYGFLGLLEAGAAMAAFFYVLAGSGWHYGEIPEKLDPLYLQATTACLSAIIVMQIVNVFLCRHPSASLFRSGLPGNTMILWGIAAEIALILLIDYTPWGNALFGTAPLAPDAWLFMLPFACAMLFLEELRKLLARRLGSR